MMLLEGKEGCPSGFKASLMCLDVPPVHCVMVLGCNLLGPVITTVWAESSEGKGRALTSEKPSTIPLTL